MSATRVFYRSFCYFGGGAGERDLYAGRTTGLDENASSDGEFSPDGAGKIGSEQKHSVAVVRLQRQARACGFEFVEELPRVVCGHGFGLCDDRNVRVPRQTEETDDFVLRGRAGEAGDVFNHDQDSCVRSMDGWIGSRVGRRIQ